MNRWSFLNPLRWPLAALLVAALALTIGGGLVHGRLRQRFGDPAIAATAAARLGSLPARIGPWQAVQSFHLSANEANILQCFGYVGRVYVHGETSERVTCSLLVGPPGPTAVHTPEVCLSNKEFRPETRREAWTVGERLDRVWTATFRSTDVVQHRLRTVFAWRGDDGVWRASDQPRWQYSMSPRLYKLQLVVEGDDGPSARTARSFLNDLLPALDSLSLP